MSDFIRKLALEIRQIEIEAASAMAPFEARKKAVYRRAGQAKPLVKLEARFLRQEAFGKPGARAAFQEAVAEYTQAQQENSLTYGIKNATRALRAPAHPENGAADV